MSVSLTDRRCQDGQRRSTVPDVTHVARPRPFLDAYGVRIRAILAFVPTDLVLSSPTRLQRSRLQSRAQATKHALFGSIEEIRLCPDLT